VKKIRLKIKGRGEERGVGEHLNGSIGPSTRQEKRVNGKTSLNPLELYSGWEDLSRRWGGKKLLQAGPLGGR